MATERSLSVSKPQTGKGSGRGGARKGSGRKPAPPDLKKVPFSARVRPCDIGKVKAFIKSLDNPKTS